MRTSTFSGSAGRIAAFLFVCAALCPIASCVKESNPGHRPERNTGRLRNASGSTGPGLYFTTVEFPEGYDWRRDSAYTSATARICLYKDGKKIMEVPTGKTATSEADMHNFIDGHLYTRKRTGRGTVLACDGQQISAFEQYEILKGLLPMQDGLYSLWESRDGNGFCLRKDSTEILRSATGHVVGDLYDYSYLPYGALYPDCGEPVFCYSDNGEWYSVIGGSIEKIPGFTGNLLDVRIIDGQACSIGVAPSGRSLIFNQGASSGGFLEYAYMFQDYGRIYRTADGLAFVVNASVKMDTPLTLTTVHYTSGRQHEIVSGFDAVPLSLGNPSIMLSFNPDGGISFQSPEYGPVNSGERCFHLGGCPGTAAGGVLAVAFNPVANGGRPLLWKDGEEKMLEINGFISGVYYASQ